MEELLQIPRDAKKHVTFPLPRDALPDVRLTPAQVRDYRASAAAIVSKTVELEHAHRENDGALDFAAGDWRLAKQKGDIRVYKRATQQHDQLNHEAQPMVLCVGTTRGTIEETLYGFHEETTEEVRAINSIVDKSHFDAAVVAVMERGTSHDPLRLLTLKWRLTATPGGALLKNRDSFTLESMGIGRDRHGKRFGHLLLKSIERPDFPAFSTSVAIRSRVLLCFIFRQLSPDTVGVYGKGIMDLGGDFSEWLCYNFASPRLATILASTRSQRAKQLTAMAIKNGRVFLPANASRFGFTRSKMASRSTMRCASIQTTRTASDTSDDSRPSRWQPPAGRPNTCLLCRKKGGSVPWMRSSLQSCQLCDKVVCGRCLVKRELLAVPTNIEVWCCKGCIITSKALPIDPHVLCPMLQY